MKRGNSEDVVEVNKKPKTILDYFGSNKKEEKKHVDIEYEKEKPQRTIQVSCIFILCLLKNVLKWKNPSAKVPPNWQEVWDGITTMRKSQLAPVDQYGAGVGNEESLSPEVKRFHTLISIMISAQTV